MLIFAKMHVDNTDISLRGAQQTVDRWIRTTGVRYFSPLTNMAVLTEEVGEVARIMARTYGCILYTTAPADE